MEDKFGVPVGDDSFEFFFGGSWSNDDNSPQGAAKRIFYGLEHGIPEDYAYSGEFQRGWR